MSDNIVQMYESMPVAEIARQTGLSHGKVRKTLISAGITPSPLTAKILKMHRSGLTEKEIADELGVSARAVNAHLPYTRTPYGLPDDCVSKNALALRRWRSTDN